VFIAISFFTFSEFVVGIVYGRDYKDTVEVLRYLMITSLIIYFNSSMMPPLIAWKKERKVLIAIALAAVVNIALNFALVPQLGPKGAALTTIFSELTFSLGLSIILIKTIQHYEFLNYLKLILSFKNFSYNLLFVLFTAEGPSLDRSPTIAKKRSGN
jgi:O-antigen/teichoic acid export membrane protein